MKPVIKLENVRKSYQMGGAIIRALDGVNTEINRGDFIVIVGPSGSGKSTMINMVETLDLVSGGEIYLDG